MDEKTKFDNAVAEYKSAIEHYKRFESILGELGVDMCPNFYKRIGGDCYDVHVYRGVSKLAEICGADLATKELAKQYDYPYEHYFNHEGLHFFEVSDE